MIRAASWFPLTVLLMCMGFVVGIATADENGYCVVVSQAYVGGPRVEGP